MQVTLDLLQNKSLLELNKVGYWKLALLVQFGCTAQKTRTTLATCSCLSPMLMGDYYGR